MFKELWNIILLYIPEGVVQINYSKMKSNCIYHSSEKYEIKHFWNALLKLFEKLPYLVTFENKDSHWSVSF